MLGFWKQLHKKIKMTELSFYDMLTYGTYENLLPDGIYETCDGGLEDDYGP